MRINTHSRSIYGMLLVLGLWGILLLPLMSASAQTPDQIGEWGSVLDWGVQGKHMALLPTDKVLVWATGDTARVWDPATGGFTQVPYTFGDLHCAGQAMLADGRVIVLGGQNGRTHIGIDETSLFDPFTNTWMRGAAMHYQRWYPTATVLPDGRVLATSGDDATGARITIPEVYDPVSDTWTDLTGVDRGQGLYPLMFVLPNGKIYEAGTGTNTWFLDLAGNGSWTSGPTNGFGSSGYAESAAMYAPGKIIRSGGGDPAIARAASIDMTATAPQWQELSPMHFPRRRHNMSILADGTVMAVGGTRRADDVTQAVLEGEIWEPTTGVWTVVAPMNEARMYHSSSLVLPDGRVLTAGGEASGRLHAQIYSPPYLFKGPRPTITTSPSSSSYGSSFAIGTPDAANIASVALLRPSTVTHAFDHNQRYVPLTFVRGTDGVTLTVTAPANANIAPPGYYMLIIKNANGVPSVAKWLRLDAGANLMPGTITGRVTNGSTGAGIANADVLYSDGSTRTGADGRYTLTNLLPGDHLVTVSAPGYATASKTQTVTAGGTFMLNFGLSAPGTIMGRVSDSVTGNGISGVTLTFNGGTTTTDPTGHYTISGIAAGSQTLTAAAIGYTSTSQTVIVSANGIVTADFVLTQAQVTVDGEVLDSITLAPIVGATVSYDGGGPATTDSVGYYVLQNVLPGTHIVTVSMNGYVSASSEVNVVTGFRATVDFNLTPTTGSTVTFTPIGDAMVKSSNPTTKYGSLGTLRVRDGDPIYHSYMKFNVAGISGPIASATIRLYATDKSNDGGSLYVVDNAWDEATITWSNAPPIAGAPIDSAGPVNTDTWIELGVTSVVTGNGTYSFALASASSTSAYYSSREGTFPPELVLVQGVVSNLPPVVHAGPDQTIALPQEVALTATVSDDGLPASTLTMAWSQSSGPGIVTFVNPTASSTTATFSTAGTYVLLLTASDTTLSASDTVTISVTAAAPVNQAPQVNAGLDQTITALSTTLTGSVTDDGLPTGSTLTRSWSQVSGPGIVTFTPPNAAVTTASFSTTGTYSLRLSASDTALSASDTVTVVVVTTGTTTVVETRVAAKIDDAEEKGSDGSMDLTSGNVDLGTKPSGMRFLLPVPPSAHITRAYVQFTADTARTGTTNLMIEGEASDNALAFGTSKHNIVNRLRTFNHISWTPAGWPTKGVAGLAQQTPDISTIIQEIVDRPGWASGQGLALIVTGTGIRQAVSYDNKPATAPLLHVEYVLP